LEVKDTVLSWYIVAITAQYAKGLGPIYHSWQILADFSKTQLQTVGISSCDGCDMPTVAPTIACSADTRQ
jgi:hypothetical protein